MDKFSRRLLKYKKSSGKYKEFFSLRLLKGKEVGNKVNSCTSIFNSAKFTYMRNLCFSITGE